MSAPHLTRKRVMKVKVEADKGSKLAGDQALWVEDLEIRSTAPFIERKGTGLHRGNTEPGVIGARSGSCSFKVELRGNGSLGMEPGVAILLQGAGFKQTVEVYQVHSTHTDDKTISIDVWEDGKKKGLAGASGNVTFEGETGGRMTLNFEFSGIWQAPIDEALPAYAPSTTPPMLIQGGTFTLATESIKISKFSLDMGNVVVPRMDVDAASGIAYFMITDYDGPILGIDPEAGLVGDAGYDYDGVWVAGTEVAVSLALTDGTDIITFDIPKYQYRELAPGDRDGIQIYDLVGQCNHNSAADCVKITVT